MGCIKCSETRERKAAGYVARALTLLREAQQHNTSHEVDAAINRLSEAATHLPDVAPAAVKPAVSVTPVAIPERRDELPAYDNFLNQGHLYGRGLATKAELQAAVDALP